MSKNTLKKLVAFCIGVCMAATAQVAQAGSPIGVNLNGDYVITATGLGVGGFAVIGTGDRANSSQRRIFLYTGAAPSNVGQVQLFVWGHPPNQAPFIQLTLGSGDDARYLGTFKPGVWPFPTQLVSGYWLEYPTFIANWQSAKPLAPYSLFTFNLWALPRGSSPEELPAQGPGVGVIQGSAQQWQQLVLHVLPWILQLYW
jgi:hypothetical protein